MIFLLFLIANAEDPQRFFIDGFTLFGIGLVALVIFSIAQNITRKKQALQQLGIDSNWGTDSFIGLLTGGGFLLFVGLIPAAALFLPSVPQSISSQTVGFFYVNFIAPVFEEGFFRGVLPWLFGHVMGLSLSIVYLASTAIFMLFHFKVYGGSFIATPIRFIAVFIFGSVAFWLVQKQASLAGATVFHVVSNLGLTTLDAAIVGGGF